MALCSFSTCKNYSLKNKSFCRHHILKTPNWENLMQFGIALDCSVFEIVEKFFGIFEFDRNYLFEEFKKFLNNKLKYKIFYQDDKKILSLFVNKMEIRKEDLEFLQEFEFDIIKENDVSFF